MPSVYLRHLPRRGHKPFPRIIKTHDHYSHRYKRSIYILRDPFSTLASYYRHQSKGKGRQYSCFRAFIEHPDYGISGWIRHLRTWRDRWDVLVPYHYLLKNTHEYLTQMIAYLGQKPDYKLVKYAVANSSMDKLEQLENTAKVWHGTYSFKPGFKFIGGSKEHKLINYYTDDDCKYIVWQIKRAGLLELVDKYDLPLTIK